MTISRREADLLSGGDPRDLRYYFGGRQMGRDPGVGMAIEQALQGGPPPLMAAGAVLGRGQAILGRGMRALNGLGQAYLRGQAAPASVRASLAAETIPSQLQLNQASEAAFQSRVSAYGNDILENFVQEVSIRPNTAVGAAPFRIRIDGLGTNPQTRMIDLLEAKASATAPLTRNQARGFPLIEQYGGTIVGQGVEPVTLQVP